MIKYFLLFLIPFSLFASKILSYNIYNRTDRVDVMITFDTPYDGVIRQDNISKSKMLIKLDNASIESSKLKEISSKLIKSLTITPMKNYTQLVASISPNTKLTVSKTADAYGLRLRFKHASILDSKNANKNITDPLASLPTKKSENIPTSYYIVVSLLIIGAIILFILKKKIEKKMSSKPSNSWLFKENKSKATKNSDNKVDLTQTNDISIRFQKALDTNNSVVMLDFADQSYLVLMGNGNILLDKFKDDKPQTQEDFESILQDRNKELNNFLVAKEEDEESLNEYTKRAAHLLYND